MLFGEKGTGHSIRCPVLRTYFAVHVGPLLFRVLLGGKQPYLIGRVRGIRDQQTANRIYCNTAPIQSSSAARQEDSAVQTRWREDAVAPDNLHLFKTALDVLHSQKLCCEGLRPVRNRLRQRCPFAWNAGLRYWFLGDSED